MKCRVGDLAIVIDAFHRRNLGHIVRVIATHDGTGDIVFPVETGQVWLVEAAQPLTWSRHGKRYRRKVGPAPDNQLQPIRGTAADDKASAATKKLLQKVMQSSAVIEA
jgi:hypothetical protein